MKKILLTILLMTYTIFYGQVNHGKIIYQASINKEIILKQIDEKAKKDHISNNRIKRIRQNLMGKILDAKDVYFTLAFNNYESLFYALIDDELHNEGDQKRNITKLLAHSESKYYTNLKKKETFKQSDLFDELLLSVKESKWILKNETKKIGNYRCLKAETVHTVEGRNGIIKKKIVAWYTPKIPIAFGILGFNGLPGLTLELSIDKKVTFRGVKIDLNPKERINIKIPRGKIVNSKELNKMIKGMMERH